MEKYAVPIELGYMAPAEWEEHEATWLAWPKSPSFPEELLPEVEDAYLCIIAALHENEKVHVLVDDEEQEKRVKGLLEGKNTSDTNIFFHRIKTGDVWFRDYGPIFIAKGRGLKREIALTHWTFNSWGNKYEDLLQDAHIPEKMPLSGMQTFRVPIVLEGGSVEMNGFGTCLTTEQCLLNKNRNPELSRDRIEQYLANYLGATNVIWLKKGIAGDDTDGHVDDIARFVAKDMVVCAVEEDQHDENYRQLNENYETLKEAKDQDGNGLKVVALPMPREVFYRGERLPASYANFYIANKVVLMPIFNNSNDQRALGMLQGLFPGRKVIGINCRALVYGFGSVHCITQQQPK